MKYPSLRILLILGLAFGPLAQFVSAQEVTISNVRAEQRSGTKLIDILYDLAYEGEEPIEIGVQVSADGGTTFDVVPVQTLTGDVGQYIDPGSDLSITWNAGSDWPQQYTDQAVVIVSAATFVPDPNAPPPGFKLIPAGTFTMGAPSTEPGYSSVELQHEVTISNDYFIQQTEMTNFQAAEILNWALSNEYIDVTLDGVEVSVVNTIGTPHELLFLNNSTSNLQFFSTEFTPRLGNDDVACGGISFYGALALCYFLSEMEGIEQSVNLTTWTQDISTTGYRLPTEAEWEYACRAGTTTAFYTGALTESTSPPVDPNLNSAGWYVGNSGGDYYPVASKSPNDYMLYDMHGHMIEWCIDWFGTYSSRPVTDPAGPASGTFKICRGGHVLSTAQTCRSAARGFNSPTRTYAYLGVRPVKTKIVSE